MTQAITTLEIALDIARNNAPIHEAAGELEQARLERETITDVSRALNILRAVEA